MHTLYQQLAAHIARYNHVLKNKTVTCGFDGFVDVIQRIIFQKPNHSNPIYFNTIKEFGQYIVTKSSSGFSLETENLQIKSGGNMPILAHALGCVGVQVHGIGALGHPEIHTAFTAMHPNCKLYSYAAPGITQALEFSDGKIMLAEMKEINQAGWGTIKNAVGLQTISRLFSDSDLIGLVNWSEMDTSSEIWEGLLDEVFTQPDFVHKPRYLFIDLSDPAKKTRSDLKKALQLISRFKNFCNIVLSLNRNEARLVHQAIFDTDDQDDDFKRIGAELFKYLSPNTLVIHTSKQSYAWHNDVAYIQPSLYTDSPKLSTGAGDNFNAGYCAGLLLESSPQQCLLLATTLSAFYVRNAFSPDPDQLLSFMNSVSG